MEPARRRGEARASTARPGERGQRRRRAARRTRTAEPRPEQVLPGDAGLQVPRVIDAGQPARTAPGRRVRRGEHRRPRDAGTAACRARRAGRDQPPHTQEVPISSRKYAGLEQPTCREAVADRDRAEKRASGRGCSRASRRERCPARRRRGRAAGTGSGSSSTAATACARRRTRPRAEPLRAQVARFVGGKKAETCECSTRRGAGRCSSRRRNFRWCRVSNILAPPLDLSGSTPSCRPRPACRRSSRPRPTACYSRLKKQPRIGSVDVFDAEPSRRAVMREGTPLALCEYSRSRKRRPFERFAPARP